MRVALLCVTVLLIHATPLRAAGDIGLGQYLAAECVSCHQPSGPRDADIPPIVGWPEDQFVAVLSAFGRKQRDGQVMQAVAARLSREEMAALAAYFGALTPQP
ncbi:hypothetical protein IP69_02450 [Bosea sp. AAP35]|nr:hypothetical protein IP69_02450 [Bosea sp. AAP35]